MKKLFLPSACFFSLALAVLSCKDKTIAPSEQTIADINLKRGNLISCGQSDKQFGSVQFAFSGSQSVREDFNLAIALLHSFEYDEAEKVFAKIIDRDPGCAMAYWGVAMANYHPLWTPPSEAELKKGSGAIAIAQSIENKTEKESHYINAAAAFYTDWDKRDHRTRTLRFEKSMEELYKRYPDDKEVAVFYALALNAAADPADKSFHKQKKAGTILESLYNEGMNHPGIVHYTIHTYDAPELADKGLAAARKYASVAPSSAHALHMPSHIFTRLGLWEDCIRSNLASVASAQCYAEAAGIKGHWDEELHGLDYLMYAYLQRGDNNLAKKQWEYLQMMTEIRPANFKVAYAFAAVPSRFVLENRLWSEAAHLPFHHANFNWKDFQWQKAILHFTRLLGSVHTGKVDAANAELTALKEIHQSLLTQKDTYKAMQVAIQAKASEAWIRLKEGKGETALALMREAADMEDKTEKHPVTPCEVLPARELLGDMLLHLHRPQEALQAYEQSLKKNPARFNSIYGAAQAAEKGSDAEKASAYYRQLIGISTANSARPELKHAKTFLQKTNRTS